MYVPPHLTKAIASLTLEILSDYADNDDYFQTGNGDDVVSKLHLNRHFVCSTRTSQQQLQDCGDLKGFPNPIKLPPNDATDDDEGDAGYGDVNVAIGR